ncbi:hypothetical protein [Maridesulfovibrio sp.]|uniref:hypothetical protein n=1 Tax=Maridesulfovibrio sp. TaxID=2795000 RepID=UPI002A1877A3|nr:hypothetical protein [Maridesulfovibrio sp.]
MAKRSNGLTEAKPKKWIKEGRGSGHGADYSPWLRVRDIASKGRSLRVFGHKSRRTHHLFSDLELVLITPRLDKIKEENNMPHFL